MEGDRRITLFRPGTPLRNDDGTPRRDEHGDVVISDPEELIRFAGRRDRGGIQELSGGAATGEWNVRFEVRTLGLDDISTDWWLRDQDGREYLIEVINEAPGDPRRRKWWLYCVTRS